MTFEPSDDFSKEAIYLEGDWEEQFEEVGSAGLAIAKGLAAPHIDTGRFIEGLTGSFQRSTHVQHPFYRISADDDASLSIEFGTSRMEGLRILRRTIEALESE